jgi:hypothetical protein
MRLKKLGLCDNPMKAIVGLLVMLPVTVVAELPACNGSEVSSWTNCSANLLLPNGDRYVGGFVAGKFSGFGKLVSKNGNTYTGEWLENMPHGLGKASFSDGRVPAERQWTHGVFAKPQALRLDDNENSQKTSADTIPVECKVDTNPTIRIPYNLCVQIGGAVLNASNLKCIIGNNPPIFLTPQFCSKASGLIVN